MLVIRDIAVFNQAAEYSAAILPFSRISYEKSKRTKKGYISDFCTLDIETTTEGEEVGYMYIWQMTIGGKVIAGRTYQELQYALKLLVHMCKTDAEHRVIIYVHNLSYEAFYLSQFLTASFGVPEMLCPQSRKPLTMIFGNGLEFRDSYKLLQKSLDKATKGLPHHKLVGELDYTARHTPGTYLTSDEWAYCLYDVVGLREAILKLYQEHSYTPSTVPLTNTGIVRESVLKVVKNDVKFRAIRNEVIPSKEQLVTLIMSMAGGDTHGSRFFAGRTIDNCNMVDIKSAHPSQMLLGRYPCGRLKTLNETITIEQCMGLSRQYAIWGVLKMTGVVIKPEVANPTISFAKTTEISDDYQLDNGRVLYADSLTLPCDSNDIYRIAHSYDYDSAVIVMPVISKLAYLPDSVRGVIKGWFETKENVEDRDSFDYMFSKICVNTIYGVCAQKPARDEHNYKASQEGVENENKSWVDVLKDMPEKDYRNLFSERTMPFVWGTWTASLTRLQLYKMQEKIGWSNVLYWDTDSIYYRGEKQDCICYFNDAKIKEVVERGAVVTNYKGEKVYIGTFEDDFPTEKYGVYKFRFLHAKCYGKITKKGLQWTIAGVSKDCAKAALKNIDDLRNGYYIPRAGGMKVKYVSSPVKIIERDGVEFPVASYIIMTPREYVVNWKPTEIISYSF